MRLILTDRFLNCHSEAIEALKLTGTRKPIATAIVEKVTENCTKPSPFGERARPHSTLAGFMKTSTAIERDSKRTSRFQPFHRLTRHLRSRWRRTRVSLSPSPPLPLSLSPLFVSLFLSLSSAPLNAAERIGFAIGPIELSVSVTDLEQFSETGEVSDELGFYLKFFNDEERAEFQTFLQKRYEVDPVPVAQFLYSPMGESLLVYLGEMVQTRSRTNGGQSLRAAAILSASDPDGFSVLDVLRNYPSYGLWLNAPRIFEVADQVTNTIDATDMAIDRVTELADLQTASLGNIDFNQMPDLRQPGSYRYRVETLQLYDASRDRTFPVDVYIPENFPYPRIPVAIISHGLGSHRAAFAHIAQQLASYGFVVAAPEHIGSNYTQQQDLLRGATSEMFVVDEFIDRPADISFVLDELERRNDAEFDGRLQLDRVGVIGHSFGGYTALAVAGAVIDFENLERDCTYGVNAVNVSLLLQCRALELPQRDYDFHDPRVGAIVTANPVNSSIFGAKGLASVGVPVLMAGGTLDPVTPLVLEQEQSFGWLTVTDKYFALVAGQSHTTEMTALTHALVPDVPDLVEPDVGLTQDYARAIPLAFLQVYLLDNLEAKAYLTPNYSQVISESPFDLYILQASIGAEGDRVSQR
ncbi:Hypothetical protein CKA32_003867 [Geitlerinema sp. FC II]|nr:Hypothetical protein CKA32_003867 [Geitlerinema sp. FC II]